MAQRVLGDGDKITLTMRLNYARPHPTSTLDDLREAVTTLEDADRIARRVLGGEHPLAMEIDGFLRKARATLRARETPPTRALTSSDGRHQPVGAKAHKMRYKY